MAGVIRLASALLVLGVLPHLGRAANLADFAVFSLRSDGQTLLPGRLYVPPAAASAPPKSLPLVLFLHGAGESGANNAAQVNGNIDNLLVEAKRRSALLYAPQTNSGWSSTTITDRVMTMIDEALVAYPVDPSRIYVTGLSMGGGGTWNVLRRYGERFAAGIPICGAGPASDFAAAALLDRSLWAFHAYDDSVVSYVESRNVFNAILTAAGEPLPEYPARPAADLTYRSHVTDAQLTVYRSGGHGIWGRVYSTPAVYDWLFARSLPVPETSTAGMLTLAVVAAAARATRRPGRGARGVRAML